MAVGGIYVPKSTPYLNNLVKLDSRFYNATLIQKMPVDCEIKDVVQ